MKLAIFVLLACTSAAFAKSAVHPLSDEFIANINNAQTTWKAGRNFDADTPLSAIRSLLGVKKNSPYKLPPFDGEYKITAVPDTFDSRDQWPDCKTISTIRDQSTCGSCWAVAAAEAISDRICIASNGETQLYISADDLLTCCTQCGDGCDGGYLEPAWNYWKNTGLVTGGPYGSKTGCKAYPFAECDHHIVGPKPTCGDSKPTPPCESKCTANTTLTYKDDRRKGKKVYSVSSNIEQEILNNGPVEAAFDVYEDWVQYKSGVYQHTTGDFLGGHAVKIIGWGTEQNTKYWLIANSWNEDWGDKGYFKIARGQDECGIESGIVAGNP